MLVSALMDAKTELEVVRLGLTDPDHWVKFPRAQPGDKRRDLYHAILALTGDEQQAVPPRGNHDETLKTLAEAIRRIFPGRVKDNARANKYDDVIDVIDFNNHEETCHKDILLVLDEAIKAA